MVTKRQNSGLAEDKTQSSKINTSLIAGGLLLILIPFIFLSEITMHNKTFQASDTKQWLGTAKVQIDYLEQTGEIALWNPNTFAGMPGYMISLPIQIYNFDNLANWLLGFLMDWRVYYLIFMGFGAFLLARRLGGDEWLSTFVGVAFQLSTYFIIILKVGHNTKFQAIAFIPWLLFFWFDVLRKMDWKAAVGFSLMLVFQLRENHPQITYYTLLTIGILSLFWLFDYAKKKDFKSIGMVLLLGGGGVLLSLASVAFPYLLNQEYSAFTIRGGSLAAGTDGLSTSYALAWSFDWLETITLFVPDYFGGHSPYYWWQMPFTEGPQYLGGVLLLLALFTFLKPLSRLEWSLWIVSGVVLLFSFGSNFSLLSGLMLDYFPFFDKFRTPSMILVILSITIPLLSILGVQALITIAVDKKHGPLLPRKFWIIGGIVIGLGFILLLASSGFDMVKVNETSRYDAQTLTFLKNERAELAQASVYRFLFINVLALALLWWTVLRTQNIRLLGIGLVAILVIDLWSYNKQYTEDMVPKRSFVDRSFTPTDVNGFISSDTSLYRVFPVGGLFEQTSFNYFHQSLGGYHGAKLSIFQDLLDRSLYQGNTQPLPFNWGLLKSFGVKYLVFPQLVNQPLPNLFPVFQSSSQKQTVFNHTGFAGRYFFVKELKVTEKGLPTLDEMNKPGWDPEVISFVNEPVKQPIGFDSTATVSVVSFEPDRIQLNATSRTDGFLFVSEMYYPAGWVATVNGSPTQIYNVNYGFRGISVPSGQSTIVFEFTPDRYEISKTIAYSGNIILMLLGLFAVVVVFRNKKNESV